MNLIIERLSWLWISLEVIGTVVVIIGVWGEEYFDRKVLPYHRQEKLKWRFWMILLGGLGIELLGVVGTTATSLALESRVEVLRKANDELEFKMRPRVITDKQIANFIFLTENFPKFPIRVEVEPGNAESLSYASQIRRMHEKAKFQIPDSDTNYFVGIYPLENAASFPILNENAITKRSADIQFVYDNTNDVNVFAWHSREVTNGLVRFDVRGEGANDFYGALINYFNQIGIGCTWYYYPDWTGTNHCAVHILQKI